MQHLYAFAKPVLGITCLVLFLSTGPTFAQSTTADRIVFGDGSDKDVTINEATTLTRDMYYHDLMIRAGQTLDTGGFRVFVSGTLTLDSGARLSRDGMLGGLSGAGHALSSGTLGGSGAGADSNGNAAESETNSLGGSGNGPDNWGVAIPPKTSVGGVGVFRSGLQALSGRSLDGELVNGGAGGSVNGGSGGGVVVVAARTVVVFGDGATISANGGAAWFGGGGGGVVVVITTSAMPAALTLSAIGGPSFENYPGRPGFTAWLN